MNEEHDQAATAFCLPHGRVNILARPVAFLDVSEMRPAIEDIPNFVLMNMMFSRKFLNDIIEPDDSLNSQGLIPFFARGISLL
jgi:hypothetical protein